MAEQHEKALVPQIRFTGFTDPWEQRKLGELFEESDERASDREILSVSVANGIYPASESDRETNPGASLANYKVVHSGDVVYNSMRMWQGAVDASRYDGIVSPAYVVAKPNSEVYARFFARLLRQPMLLKQYQQVSQGNSKDTQVLKFDDFASIEISMPASENEQRQIGAFFDRLDSLITLHQRKYDKLCVLKKSMLDKMFPKGGSMYPEIRFAGFTDPWEQRKLGELFEESDERASDREILSVSVANGIYPASESDRETNPGASLANYKVVHSGDVVYNSMRMWQGAVDASRYDGIVSPAYVVAKPNSEVYARFFARLLRQPMLLKQYQQVSQGNSKDTQVLKFDDFASIEISMPASENEQRQIGAFFDRLDSLITLHQRKYDKLCVLKKSMLDKMFPKGGSMYPEIRFAGFTDPWEQRKLGQHLKLSRELGHTGVDARKLTVKLWGKGVVEKTDLYGGSAQTQYYIRHAGQFMYGKLDFLHAAFGVVPDKLDCFESTLDSPAFDIEGLDSSFLLNLVTQEDFYLKNGNIANGSRKAKRIHEETFLNMEIRAPELVEQRRIGAFLDRLDSLITLHQRKLELLRNIKKSMLDKMFV